MKRIILSLSCRHTYKKRHYIDVYLAKLTAFRDRCEKAIGGADMKICVENADGYDKEFLQKGFSLLLESKTFVLTFDIGHNAGIGGGDEEVIMKYKNKLCHMHMHDVNEKSSHLPLGIGELDRQNTFTLQKSIIYLNGE